MSYAETETMPAMQLCDHLLRKATYRALDLISDLAKSGDFMAAEDYASLVVQYVLRHWAGSTENLSSTATDRPVNLDEMANRLFQLCPDQTVMGNHLLQGVNQILSGQTKGFHELSAAVDILVHAHNSFALSNNVEGIAGALHLARTLAKEIEQVSNDSHLQLLVKMLHRIGRYGEMSYILDILYRNNKLPFVFQIQPQNECSAQFRTSLLEFLRSTSQNQGNQGPPDLYRHVCLQYGMGREVAQLLYDSATSDVEELSRAKNSVDLNTWASEANHVLPICAQKFVDAAKGFSKAECPNLATVCIKQARLVALQLRFLSEGSVSLASASSVAQQHEGERQNVKQVSQLVIIGRTNPDHVKELVTQQVDAFESLIIQEAYKVDYWAEAVFRQVVTHSKNARYFHDMMAFYNLTDKFFEVHFILAFFHL